MTINELFGIVNFCKEKGLSDWIVNDYKEDENNFILIKLCKGEPIRFRKNTFGDYEPVYSKEYVLSYRYNRIRIFDKEDVCTIGTDVYSREHPFGDLPDAIFEGPLES